ncbi:phosphoribosylanthranilate isomerase [Streptococcus fryi]
MFEHFLQIAKHLNQLGITPLLMGSLGLERRTGIDWKAKDIDIHVPSDPRGWEAPDDERIYRADELIAMMEGLGFILIDRHEHAFQKGHLLVEFGGLHSLPSFAGVALEDLEEIQTDGVSYYLPKLEQYLKIYQASSKDSYRADKNNHKDFAKIAYLENRLTEKME